MKYNNICFFRFYSIIYHLCLLQAVKVFLFLLISFFVRTVLVGSLLILRGRDLATLNTFGFSIICMDPQRCLPISCVVCHVVFCSQVTQEEVGCCVSAYQCWWCGGAIRCSFTFTFIFIVAILLSDTGKSSNTACFLKCGEEGYRLACNGINGKGWRF